jgi:uncharacterized protein YyaL (SSP411 family)
MIPESKKDRSTNRLIHEKSPYLLQHAHNPVDWYPWGKEAFERAGKENKPVFLSIGYATCHWCHVMEKESFENPEVARLMNEALISIKVDREERPDIDTVYMKVCQILTGSGGWPLTIIMTPDKKPFFAATYIPKENRFGRLGMLELIPRIQGLWENNRAELETSADNIVTSLKESAASRQGEDPGEDTLDAAYHQLEQQFDAEHGGFGISPKFPAAHTLLFLLRYWRRTGNENALQMVEKTLQSMRRGGLFDHIGYGFHRYSTDAHWMVPHFEKMLYDQALLAMAYTEAFQVTGNHDCKNTAKEIFAYVLRDMTSPEGAFYSAEDADSEGEEGKFYLWTSGELEKILSKEDADLALRVFNVEKDGNFAEEASGRKTGTNILHQKKSLAKIASELKLSPEALSQNLESIRVSLFKKREKRVRPLKDDKVLADWNGLMITALAKASVALDEPAYETASQKAAGFILRLMRDKQGRLSHRNRGGQSSITAFLDDYAFLIWGLLELYEATFDARFLKEALELNEVLIRHFWDEKDGGFYFTPDDGEQLLLRQKELYDGAIPSGNSVQMLNLLRLGRMTSNPELEKKAARTGRIYSKDVELSPSAFTQMMAAVDFGIGPSHEVVVVGATETENTKAMLKALWTEFSPNKVVLFIPTDKEPSAIFQIAPFTSRMTSIESKATAYVCQNYTCQQPTTDIETMLQFIGVKALKKNTKS